MSKREWKLFVEDILESIGFIEKFTEDMELDEFKRDRKTIDAVVRNFEIIGEAVKYVPDHIKERHAEVDWKGITGLRNRISHEYFGVSVNIIWHIIKEELKTFKEQMKQILSESGK